jgi:hypothetical protein
MGVSVLALPFGRYAAERWGAGTLARRTTAMLAILLVLAAAPGVLDGAPAIVWAFLGGSAAGALYAAVLALVASHAEVTDRLGAMAAVHAAGNAGHATGAIVAGGLLHAAPPTVAVAIAGLVLAALGAALTGRTSPASCAGPRG